MLHAWRFVPFLGQGCVLVIAACGCSGPSSQLARCQQDKEQLLATIRDQRDTTRRLRDQVASLEKRLDEAERELAVRVGGPRLSSRPDQAAPPSKPEPLPWRPPAGKSGPAGQQPSS